jgi:hypothetical protein
MYLLETPEDNTGTEMLAPPKGRRLYRRLPSLPDRRFPNLRKVRIIPAARLFARPADWEAGGTSGLEMR